VADEATTSTGPLNAEPGRAQLPRTMSATQAASLEAVLQNYRMTPATLARKLSLASHGEPWIPAPHLMEISLEVAKAIKRGGGRIIISAPPRHGKSFLCNRWLPVWVLENFPAHHVITATYGADLSTDFTRPVRDLFGEHGPAGTGLLSHFVRADAARADNFVMDHGGTLRGVGLGGPITGRGAHVFILDDYIKDFKEAMSPTYRDSIWDWFVNVALTRLEPNATIIIIATRWHHDDLIGRIKKNYGDKWLDLRYPAIAGADDRLGRVEGTPLFPERFGLDYFAERKEMMGTFMFNAQYQQNPTSKEDGITYANYIKVTDTVPHLGRMLFARVWDFAGSDKDRKRKRDHSVGALLGFDPLTLHLYIMNVVRKQLSPAKLESLVTDIAVADGYSTPIFIEQEPGASGKQVVEDYANRILKEFRVTPVLATMNKLVKAQPFLAHAEAGKVFMVKASWNQAFVDELNDFPDGKWDDQVDAIATGFLKLMGKKRLAPVWGRTIAKFASQETPVLGGDEDDETPSTLGNRLVTGATFGRSRRGA
jgi:predicted phage terminase large subunit-like protein